LPTLILIGTVLALVILAAVRATWTPVAPLRIGRRRSWGQVLSASGRMYAKRPVLFLGLGFLLIPIAFVITLLQWFLLKGIDLAGVVTGEAAGTWAFLAAVIGATFTFFGLSFVQAATACALVEIDQDRSVGPLDAYGFAWKRVRPLLGATSLWVVAWLLLTTTVFLLPVAVWLAIRWCLAAPVVALEGRGPFSALRRSSELVRHRWFRVGSLVGLSGAIALLAGPLLGAILIVLTDTPLATLNIVAGVVYALSMPFVALATAYVYFDARTRVELELAEKVTELPAEISLESA
jgi:Membrane domain of glycerophosphoryl diester phosphodiesterase